MKKIPLITLACFLAASTVCDQQRVIASLQAAAKSPPRDTAQPEVFGAGVLSTGEIYRGCFAPDGRAFYFFKKVTRGQEDYRIFVSHLTGGKWSEPQRVNLGGDYSDLYPTISKDGRRMVFSSYRPAPGDTSAKPNAHLWYVDRKGEGWGEAVFMTAANTLGHYHPGPEYGPDGAIYFNKIAPNIRAKLVTRWNGKEFGPAEPVAEIERWRKWRNDLFVWGGTFGPNGACIILSVSQLDPQTRRPLPTDIWVTLKTKDGWTEPKPFGAGINSDKPEGFVSFSPDGKQMFFIRDNTTFYRIPLAAALKEVAK
ncbi:MAG: hypothetical protein MOB07_15015 [Acidobacteria bacterium]|nr:hypothetical protein [Acidobacteriota bacterium]